MNDCFPRDFQIFGKKHGNSAYRLSSSSAKFPIPGEEKVLGLK